MKIKFYKRALLILPLLVAALFIQACGRDVKPEPSCNFVQNSKLQRVSWRGRVAKFYIHISVPQEYHAQIREAAQVWNSELGKEVISIESIVNGGSAPKQDGYNIIYWMNEWEENKRSEQARTTIYWSGSKIYEADIKINAKDHNFSVAANAVGGKVDFYSLMVHEFGHVLGLTHIHENKPSVMHAFLANGNTRRSLTETDLSSLRCEYGI